MQTFLPFPDFVASLAGLDRQRLGKQRVETHMIIEILRGKASEWSSHPAVTMWRGFEGALTEYYNESLKQWAFRGYQNKLLQPIFTSRWSGYPSWFGLNEFHASHRSNLLRKLPEWYGRFGWLESSDLPYYWP